MELAKKTARKTFVASGTCLLDAEEDSISIAVDVDVDDALYVAALFTFAPETLAAATVINRPAGSQCFVERFAIHPSQHQYLASPCVLRDGR